MGLDMFLYGVKQNEQTEENGFEGSGVYEEVCYWRKANQIHKWFSNKFIKKQDPWGIYIIQETELQGLLLLCKLLKTLKLQDNDIFSPIVTDRIKEELDSQTTEETQRIANELGITLDYVDKIALALLPPDNIGCFFGSGTVDEDYWRDIDTTINQITEALEKSYDFYIYSASW